jgi:NAD(P)-dependent dehydrogenase (short-subunit alcohol dehydrogenase family)
VKNAVVTGGGSGIGQAIANRLRADGYHVATIDLNPSDAEFAYTADVTDRAAIEEALTAIRAQLGPVTILANAAGLDGFKRFLDIDFETWQRVINVNLHGVFHCIQAVLPDMIEAGWGRIVNISSSSQVRRQRADQEPGAGVRTRRHHGQRGAARVHRHPDAAQGRGPRLPRRHRQDHRADAGTTDRQARGHRRRMRLPHLRGGRLHHRADSRRQRRTQHLTADQAYEGTTSGTC